MPKSNGWRFTDEQAILHARLSRRIAKTYTAGGAIACVEDPEAFDRPHAKPAVMCEGCPVLTTCQEFAATRAVRWGVMAGRDLTPKAERGKATKTPKTTKPRTSVERVAA